jgi:transcriptional regulator with XRE-family HTH domain
MDLKTRKKPPFSPLLVPQGASPRLANVLRKWREQNRLSQRLAAKALGVKLGTFRAWEQGVQFPQLHMLHQLFAKPCLGMVPSLKAKLRKRAVRPRPTYPKLTDTDAKAIHALRATHRWTRRELAQMFGVSRGSIQRAIKRFAGSRVKVPILMQAKLSAKDVKAIRSRAKQSYTQLAKEYGVERNTIVRIARKQTWKHLPGKVARRRRPKGENHVNAKLTRNKVIKIRTLWESNEHTFQEMADMFGVSPMTIHAVISGKAWTHVGKKGGCPRI